MALEHIKKKLSEQERGKKRTKQESPCRSGRKITIRTTTQAPVTFNEWVRQMAQEEREAAAEAGLDPSATNNPSLEESVSEQQKYWDNPNNPLYGLRIRDTSCQIPDESLKDLNFSIQDESLVGLQIPKSALRGLDIPLF